MRYGILSLLVILNIQVIHETLLFDWLLELVRYVVLYNVLLHCGTVSFGLAGFSSWCKVLLSTFQGFTLVSDIEILHFCFINSSNVQCTSKNPANFKPQSSFVYYILKHSIPQHCTMFQHQQVGAWCQKLYKAFWLHNEQHQSSLGAFIHWPIWKTPKWKEGTPLLSSQFWIEKARKCFFLWLEMKNASHKSSSLGIDTCYLTSVHPPSNFPLCCRQLNKFLPNCVGGGRTSLD